MSDTSEASQRPDSRLVSVAPMMDCTDRHCRYLMRLLAPHVRLYTEMVHANAVLKGDREKVLGFDVSEHPLALQLGGSDPASLARAAAIAAERGFDEVNLNIGCPSDRVQSGQFGACLMADPDRVADCVAAMNAAVKVPVTVKTRVGIDDHDDDAFLMRFIERVRAGGCRHFIIHARKALLSGLSPKQNRSVPPLNYPRVYRLKEHAPELFIVINGGIDSIADVRAHLNRVDGIMIGRKAYADPFFLARLQHEFVSASVPPVRDFKWVVSAMADYAERELAGGTPLHHITRHMTGLAAGRPGARRWRRFLTEQATRPGAGPEVLRDSLEILAAVA